MRRHGPWIALVGVAAVLATTGMGFAAVVDALGRTVPVGVSRRIVSLVPSVTEILFALGAGARVVGVTRFCDYPPEASELPQVGGYSDPNLEAVVSLAPDLVFAAADATPRSVVDRLDDMGTPVYVVYPRSYQGTIDTILQVGKLSGTLSRAAALARELETARDAVSTALPVRPRVLVCVMTRPLVVAGPRTLAGDLVRLVGAENVVPDGPGRYPTWGMEGVLAADPDVIVVSAHPGDPGAEEVFSDWPELRAVASGNLVNIDADWIHRPGPRLSLGIRSLYRATSGNP